MSFIEIEKSVHTNEWSMHDLHSHPHYEIYFLKSGSRSFFLSNALFNLEAPIVIVIPPHVLHKTEGGPFERYNINVSANYLDEFQKDVLDAKSLQIIKPSERETEMLTTHLDALSEPLPKKYEQSITHTIVSYIILSLGKWQQSEYIPKITAKNSIPPLLLKVIDYLHEHYSEKLTLEDLAEQFFVSKTALSYGFKKHMDCTLIDFLLSLRITKAKEYLLGTRKSIEEISELCGFSSANYFGLIFKQKENLSPANYRKHQNTKE